MDTTSKRTRWANAFVYAFVTTVMVLSVASFLAFATQGAQRALADRVDRNAAAIVCILRLGVAESAPPRSPENVDHCLADPAWVGERP